MEIWIYLQLPVTSPESHLPEIMLPETGGILSEIHYHVARNSESHRQKFYRVYKLEKKNSNNLCISQGINSLL